MARAKVFGNHILLLLLAVSCVSLPDKESIYLNQTISLKLPSWISHGPPAWISTNTRYITASGPAVLQEILQTTGCMDGTAAISLETHTLFQDRDFWEVICGSRKREKIVLVFPDNREEKYNSYKNTIQNRIQQADLVHRKFPAQSAAIYREVLQIEPSLVVPQLRLALYYLAGKNCSAAKYHAGIFTAIHPGFGDRSVLEKKIEECSG